MKTINYIYIQKYTTLFFLLGNLYFPVLHLGLYSILNLIFYMV